MNKLMIACLLAAGALQAQGVSYGVKVGLAIPQGHLEELTQQKKGWVVEGTVTYKLNDEGFGLRGHVGLLKADGKEQNLPLTNPDAYTADAKATTFGLDLVYPVGSTPVSLSIGPTMSSWGFKMRNHGKLGDRAWKLGLRAGARYDISTKWGAELTFQMSEWGTYTPKVGRARLVHPSFFSLGVTYAF